MSAAPDSPLTRLRASYAARQQADPDRFVDIWEDGELVAQVARTEDMAAASDVMRTMGAIVNPAVAAQLEITADALADILAAATVALFVRDPDGTLEPIPTEHGLPMRFDASFGAVIGVPEITTPRGAVFAAFTSPATEDGPPTLDALRLMVTVTKVCTTLMSTRDARQAREVVGKVSATGNGATPP